jgi:uncharacterized protein with HEPN domain
LSFRDAHRHLRDIQTGIDHIDAFLANMDFAAYQSDLKTRSAGERQLQIITEAAIRLGDEADSVCPGPDWKGLRGMGNFLRHAYHRVDDKIVWETLQQDLPPLKVAVARALTRP